MRNFVRAGLVLALLAPALGLAAERVVLLEKFTATW